MPRERANVLTVAHSNSLSKATDGAGRDHHKSERVLPAFKYREPSSGRHAAHLLG
jgi:hypothetical protein